MGGNRCLFSLVPILPIKTSAEKKVGSDGVKCFRRHWTWTLRFKDNSIISNTNIYTNICTNIMPSHGIKICSLMVFYVRFQRNWRGWDSSGWEKYDFIDENILLGEVWGSSYRRTSDAHKGCWPDFPVQNVSFNELRPKSRVKLTFSWNWVCAMVRWSISRHFQLPRESNAPTEIADTAYIKTSSRNFLNRKWAITTKNSLLPLRARVHSVPPRSAIKRDKSAEPAPPNYYRLLFFYCGQRVHVFL